MRWPLFGFALLVFVLLAVVLAIGIFFAFKSGEQGKTKLGGCAGCAIGFALLVITGMGAVGLIVVSVAALPGELLRHGPVESVELTWDEGRGRAEAESPSTPPAPAEVAPRGADANTPAAPSASTPERSRSEAGDVQLRVVLRGDADPGEVVRWLRRRTDADARIRVTEARTASGASSTVIEVIVPLSAGQRERLQELRREIEKEAPDLRLPRGAKVELRGLND